MKRPKHMTMNELLALPVVKDREQLRARPIDYDGYGGSFRDDGGSVWGTAKLGTGWVRYPAYLSLLN